MAGEVVGSARIVIEPDMSGFSSALSSDVQSAAQRAADAMERAFVTSADASADAVSAISSQLTGMDLRVDVDDTQLDQLAADLRPLTGEEKQIVIGAQIGEAQRQIQALDRQIGAATEPEEIQILVDQRGEAVRKLNQLESEVEDVGDELGSAAGAAFSLGDALKGLGALAIGKGLFDIAQGASELEQAVGGTETLFGDAADTIANFADTAAVSFGLTEREARNLTSQLGGLLRGFDYTRDEAAKTSIEIAKLGADLAAAYGGSVTDAVDALGAALRGEFNPLERFGVAMNVAQINAYALENGLAASTSEITLATRASAALALIQERTTDVQGQFTRELSTAGGVMATTRAVMGDLADQAGEALLPGLIAMAEVLRDDAGPALLGLAEAALPLVTQALEAFAPMMGTTTDLLVAITPIVEAFAWAVSIVPDEVLAVAGALFAMNKALKAISFASAAAGMTNIASGATKLTRSLSLFSKAGGYAAAFAGLAIGVGELGNQLSRLTGIGVPEDLSEWQDQIQSLGEGKVTTFPDMDKLVESLNRVADPSVWESATGTVSRGIGFLGEVVTLGQLDVQTTADKLDDRLKEADRALAAIVGNGNLDAAVRAFEDIKAAAEEGGVSVSEIMDDFGEFSAAAEEAILAQDGWTQAMRVSAQVAKALLSEEDYLEYLVSLRPELEANAAAAAKAVEQYGHLASVGGITAESLDALKYNSGTLSVSLLNLQAGAGDTGEQLFNLAIAAGDGALAEEQMADLAAVLGVRLEDLEGFIESVNESLNDFVSSAMSGIPGIQDAFQDLNEDGKVSARELVKSLKTNAESIRSFQADLASIQEAGFTSLAAIIAEKGPEVGAALAEELANAAESGNTALLDEVALGVLDAQDAYNGMEEYLRTELGPKFILTSGLLGSAATAAFGSNLTFGERMKLAGQIAELQLSEEGKAIAAVAAVEGADAARAYGQGLGLDDAVIEEGIKAGNALRNLPTDGASAGGDRAGAAFVGGMAGGIYARIREVEAAARSMVTRSIGAALGAMAARSPSRVMFEAGTYFGEGMALGIAAQEQAVVAAAEDITRAAAEAGSHTVPTVDAQTVEALSEAQSSRAGSALVGASGSTIEITVNVNGPVDVGSARAVGDTVAGRVAQVLAARTSQTDIRLAGTRTAR